MCLEHPSRSAWRWTLWQLDYGQRSSHHGATTAAACAQPPGRRWGKKPVCVRACTRPCQVLGVPRARVRAALAMCAAGHVCQPAAPARARVLCVGWACFCSTHAFICRGGLDSERARAFDVCACRALQVFHACRTSARVCACVRPCTCVCARVCSARSVSQLAAAPAAGIPASQAVLEMNTLESIFSPSAARFHSAEKRSRALYLH